MLRDELVDDREIGTPYIITFNSWPSFYTYLKHIQLLLIHYILDYVPNELLRTRSIPKSEIYNCGKWITPIRGSRLNLRKNDND